jgi:Cu-processing system permease protein
VGMLIGVLARRTAVATGVAVFVWLVLVFGTDLGIMAGTLSMSLSIESLFAIAIVSPLQVFKMASLQFVDASLDVLGPAGLYAQTEYATSLPWIFGGVLLAWIVVPLWMAWAVMNRRSPV